MDSYVSDPWKARDDYIDVILDRSPGTIEAFFSNHAVRSLSKEDKVQVLELLEMQRNGMLMYTGCGWFFEDISGIESVQVMRYACRAMQLAREVAGAEFEPEFIHILEKAPVTSHNSRMAHRYTKILPGQQLLIFQGLDFTMPYPHWLQALLKRSGYGIIPSGTKRSKRQNPPISGLPLEKSTCIQILRGKKIS